MRLLATALAFTTALLLTACGGKSATDTVDDSTLTAVNGIGLSEGTTNDSAALESDLATAPTPMANAATNAQEADETGNATKR